MFDAVDVQRRAHHGDVAAGHDALDYIFGRMHATGDGDVDVEMAVENRGPVQAGQQFGWRGEMQSGRLQESRCRNRADRSD